MLGQKQSRDEEEGCMWTAVSELVAAQEAAGTHAITKFSKRVKQSLR